MNLKDLEDIKYMNLKRGTVWKIDDSKIILDRKDDKLIKNKPRYVLITSSERYLDYAKECINVIPLTTKGCPDLFCFPIDSKFKETFNEFKVSPKSLAVTHYCQPVRIETLEHIVGILDECCFEGIILSLCQNVFGHDCFEPNLDI